MAAKKKTGTSRSDRSNAGQSGGVNISVGNGNVSMRDVAGRDKVTTTYTGGSADLAQLIEQFEQIKQRIATLPVDADVKEDLSKNVERIQEETKKGEQADPSKVERWLRFLAGMSDDIFQVTVNTLANPALGIATVIQRIAQRAREEKASG